MSDDTCLQKDILYILLYFTEQAAIHNKKKTKNNRLNKNINTYTTAHTNARQTIKRYTRKTNGLG